MKRLLLATALCLSMLSAHAADANYNVVPLPKSVVMAKGLPFNLTNATTIVYEGTNPEMKRNARFLSEYIQQASGIKTAVLDKRDKKAAAIVLTIDPKVTGAEAYRLSVNNKQVTIAAQIVARANHRRSYHPARSDRCRRSTLWIPRYDARLRTPFLPPKLRKEIYRHLGHAQYERVPLASH